MKQVLLIDHSGRGHAIADTFVRTNEEVVVHYAPGCVAISHPRIHCHPELSLAEPAPFVAFALKQKVELVFVSNTAALASGFVDSLREAGLSVIGPDREASELEASKIYGKRMCQAYGIPVSHHQFFDSPTEAHNYVDNSENYLVVKADGLCAGAGTFVCHNKEDAHAAISTLMEEDAVGDAGRRIVIEDRLFGRELSFFALIDGLSYLLLPLAADYPRSDDANAGVTCGGVGAFSPHPLETDEVMDTARTNIFDPLMRCIQEENLQFSGCIYVGAMLTEDGLYVLEINIRLGDPEAQVILPRLENDFYGLCEKILQQSLSTATISLNPDTFCAVVACQGKTRQLTSTGASKGWYNVMAILFALQHFASVGLFCLNPEKDKSSN